MLVFTVTPFVLSGCHISRFSSSGSSSSTTALGDKWVTNVGSNNVTELSPSGTLIGTYVVGSVPNDITIELSGNNGEYFPYKGPEWP